MQFHRQEKQNTKQQSQTQEVTPMATPSQLFQPDAAHLKRLQDFEVGQYKTRTQCNVQGKEQLGIMEEFEVQGLQQALDRYAELTTVQGYRATGEIAHLPKVIAGPTVDWVILSLRKPESQVEQEIAQIKADVEATYLAQLADAKAACVAKEVESLLAGEKRRKQQAELDAKAALEAEDYARVEAEVLAALGGKQ
ncbi:hypothetical protein [Pseudomonas atacamensis]|uniref:hypothetical protein n=1 Tax=Pseudomonas atacamensis TaxID=2565368 RepID=UPI0024805397|nr:hypothetical protein [Pseudomonas atacamensis]WGT32986.1 hypothetical protein QG303_21850 [Pseudomonas atacamensis]